MKKYLILMSLTLLIFAGCKKDQSTVSDQDPAKASLDKIMANMPKSISLDYRDSTSTITYIDGRVVRKSISNSVQSSDNVLSLSASGETETGKGMNINGYLSENPAQVSCYARYTVGVMPNVDLPPYYYIKRVDEQGMSLVNGSSSSMLGQVRTTYYSTMSSPSYSHSSVGSQSITFYYSATINYRVTTQYGNSAPISSTSIMPFSATAYGSAP